MKSKVKKHSLERRNEAKASRVDKLMAYKELLSYPNPITARALYKMVYGDEPKDGLVL